MDILNARILIVDDLAVNVRLLEQMLRGAGYTCIASTMDSRKVCELHRQNHYDLILLDLRMPAMDGFAVMEALKAIEPDNYVPVIVITAQPGHQLRALEAGAKDFISKPFDMPTALLRIRNMLEVRLMFESARKDANLMESLALCDPLTGLANRRLLDDPLSLAMSQARRNRHSLALLCLDIDEFKRVNDVLGHDGGDELLKLVAQRLLAAVRKEDTVARQGGDEFSIVLRQVQNSEAACTVAEKILRSVAQVMVIDGQTLKVTVSIGISLYPQYGEDEETLMKNADLALYEAKHAGKNRYRIAPPSSEQARSFNLLPFGGSLPVPPKTLLAGTR